jgi:hypothetical protein
MRKRFYTLVELLRCDAASWRFIHHFNNAPPKV